MSLESGTFISDLVATNPPGTDKKKQGDDHLRLIKSVLRTTLPNATKAFYFPDSSAKTANYSVVAADQNKIITGDATGGAFNVTLPTLTSGDAGWLVGVIKIDASANAVTVVGTVNGATNYAISTRYRQVVFQWSGTAWYAFASFSLQSQIAATEIADHSITGAKLAQLAALSVLSNPTNALADVAVLTAAVDGQVLLRSGTTLVFGQIVAAGITDGTITLVKLSTEAGAFGKGRYQLRDEKASGTDGDAVTSGSWQQAVLQTEKADDLTLTTTSNVIQSLPAGTYYCEAEASGAFAGTATHGGTQACIAKLRLRNTTDGATLLTGIPVRHLRSDDGGGSDQPVDLTLTATMRGYFTLAGAKNVQLDRWLSNGLTSPTTKSGRPSTTGEVEVYADLRLWKIA